VSADVNDGPGPEATGRREATEGGEAPRAREGPKPRGRSRAPFFGLLWEWTRSAAVAFVLFLVVRTFLVEAFKIPTSSMERTLLVGDFLLVNKAVYGAEIPATGIRLPAIREPERGEVVVFNPPHELDKNYVKRVVGVPGDTVSMRDKELFVNGARQSEPYARYVDRNGDAVHPGMAWQERFLLSSLHASDHYRPSRDNWGPLVVPSGKYFVLGDNRDNSEDSRYWGFVDRAAIRGRPLFVYYSFEPRGDSAFPWLERVRWRRIGDPIR